MLTLEGFALTTERRRVPPSQERKALSSWNSWQVLARGIPYSHDRPEIQRFIELHRLQTSYKVTKVATSWITVGRVNGPGHGNDPDDHRADIAQDGPQGQALESERGVIRGSVPPSVFPGDPRPFNALREGRTESFEPYPGQLDLFRAMAGDVMPRADFAEGGRLCAADLRRIGAARVEVAA